MCTIKHSAKVSRSCWNACLVGLSEEMVGSEALGEWELGEKQELLVLGTGRGKNSRNKDLKVQQQQTALV